MSTQTVSRTPFLAVKRSLFPLSLVAMASLGCSTIEYKAREDVVTEIGAEKARTELKDLVLASKAVGGGVVTGVDVSDESVKVKSQQTTMGAFYQMQTSQLENEIYFRMLERVDLYTNNWAYVYVSGGRLALYVLLKSPEEAKRFADLMSSMKAGGAPRA